MDLNKDILAQIKEEGLYPDRRNCKGIVNDKAGTSILLDNDGSVNIIASQYAQIKIDKSSSSISDISMQKTITTNRYMVNTDELLINNCKLNQQIFNFAGFKDNGNFCMGNLEMAGTVLVKTWEPNLNKYVFIRRLAVAPIFLNEVTATEIPSDMNVTGGISSDVRPSNK